VRRWVDGKPVEVDLTYGMSAILQRIQKTALGFAEKLGRTFANQLQKKCFDVPTSWNLRLRKPFSHSEPLVNDDIVPAMLDGKIVPVSAIDAIKDSKSIELTDNTSVADVDVIIFCTGYKANFSTLAESPCDPTKKTVPEWSTIAGSKNLPLPYLHQNIFSVDFPDSLAFTCQCAFQMPLFVIYELASMAVAQVWKGKSSWPPKEEMIRHAEACQNWMCGRAKLGSAYPDLVRVPDWYSWINNTAGTGLNDRLGYAVSGWKFWIGDRRLSNLLMWGVWRPHIYRLFEGPKRKAWSGAGKEIERVNHELNQILPS
jgi:dimethylaniline monooxygenase (N-oxide forming)